MWTILCRRSCSDERNGYGSGLAVRGGEQALSPQCSDVVRNGADVRDSQVLADLPISWGRLTVGLAGLKEIEDFLLAFCGRRGQTCKKGVTSQ
jgi:hypothetical protein